MEFNISNTIFHLFFYLNICTVFSKVELFTSSAQLRQVIYIEKDFSDHLGSITLKKYERQLEEFRQFYNRLENRMISSWRSNYNNDRMDTVRDPLATFINLYETTNVWLNVGNDNPLINQARKDFNDILSKQYASMPSKEDLEGSANAIFRLQSTYHLTSRYLFEQFLGEYTYRNSHTCDAILMLGKFAYDNEDYRKTKMWLDIAMEINNDKIEDWNDDSIKQRIEILDHLAFAEYMLGNDSLSLSYTEEILRYDPQHSRALENLIIIQSLLQTQHQKSIDFNIEADQIDIENDKEDYRTLCRDMNPIDHVTSSSNDVKCSYQRRSPIQYLKPIPYEVVSVEPRIVIYHEVVTNDEIIMLKQMAYHKLRRATVNNHNTGEIVTADYRISKSGWLMDDETVAISDINKRLEELTGLTSSTAESWQVANYGLGGHYEPHYDWSQNFSNSDLRRFGNGDRVATLLLYLSDVEAGGATVFLDPKVAVFPRKGSAVFWYNLHRNGKGDSRTKHAACPVLYGEKWDIKNHNIKLGTNSTNKVDLINGMVNINCDDMHHVDVVAKFVQVANKWFHEVGQEFRRPCSTNSWE